MLEAKKRLNFVPEMQYKAASKCNISIRTERKDGALGWYMVK